MDAIKDHTIAYLVKRLRDKDAVTEPVRHEAADELERLSRALELRSEEVVGALRYIEGKPANAKLRDRCRALIRSMEGWTGPIRREGHVDKLVDFVVAETGRTADMMLDDSLPLCVYFPTKEDRAEFIEAMKQAKPDMIMKEMP